MTISTEIDFAPVNHIEVRNGQARLLGRNLKVKMVISRLLHSENATIEEVMTQYQLSYAEVHACLAYYYDNRDAIDQHFREQDNQVQQLATPMSALMMRLTQQASDNTD